MNPLTYVLIGAIGITIVYWIIGTVVEYLACRNVKVRKWMYDNNIY